MKPLGKISVGVVLDDSADVQQLLALNATVDGLEADTEIVVVANAISHIKASELLKIVDQMADTTIHFIEDKVDPDYARLIIIDNAIGDWILLAEPEDLDVVHWQQLAAAARDGAEVIMAAAPTVGAIDNDSLLRRIFLAFYRLITRLPVSGNLPATRLYSRAAALYLIGRVDSIMLFKCPNLGPGFPAQQVPRENGRQASNKRSLLGDIQKAYRALYNANALPVRSIVFIALLAAVFNIVFSGYTVFVYLSDWVVAPGWVTQSLQISGMFFLFSILFALLGERLISIEKSVTYRLRYNVIREVRSPRSNAVFARNVVTTEHLTPTEKAESPA